MTILTYPANTFYLVYYEHLAFGRFLAGVNLLGQRQEDEGVGDVLGVDTLCLVQ